MNVHLHLRRALLLALTALLACRPSGSANSMAETSADSSSRMEAKIDIHRSDGPPRNLAEDEAAGGHVLRKHVGRTDDELRARLERERNISGASTYTDQATAEWVVGNAIGYHRDRIQRWLERPGGHANLVLDYDADSAIGRTLNRGNSQPAPCSHALVVLKFDFPARYHVLTSYPECRS